MARYARNGSLRSLNKLYRHSGGNMLCAVLQTVATQQQSCRTGGWWGFHPGVATLMSTHASPQIRRLQCGSVCRRRPCAPSWVCNDSPRVLHVDRRTWRPTNEGHRSRQIAQTGIEGGYKCGGFDNISHIDNKQHVLFNTKLSRGSNSYLRCTR